MQLVLVHQVLIKLYKKVTAYNLLDKCAKKVCKQKIVHI